MPIVYNVRQRRGKDIPNTTRTERKMINTSNENIRIDRIDDTGTTPNGRHVIVEYRQARDGEDIDDAVVQRIITTWDDDVDDAINAFLSGDPSKDSAWLLAQLGTGFSTAKAKVQSFLMDHLERITDNITSDGEHMYIDNAGFSTQFDPILEDHLVNIIKTDKGLSNAMLDKDFKSLCAFANRLYKNTDPDIRRQLVPWLEREKWNSFTEDGRLIGYRGVQINSDGVPESVHSGSAYVNGVLVNGHIPNPDGAIVEMDRTKVTCDPQQGCSSGLHVGTYQYAVGWAPAGGWLLRVAVAPEDIVSVPYDCSSDKIRTCRFEVLSHEPAPAYDEMPEDYRTTFTYGDDDEYDDDEYDDDYDDDWDDGEDDDDDYSYGDVDIADAAWNGAGWYAIRQDDYTESHYCDTYAELLDAIDGADKSHAPVTDAWKLNDGCGTIGNPDGEVDADAGDSIAATNVSSHATHDCTELIGHHVTVSYAELDGRHATIKGVVEGAGTTNADSMLVRQDTGAVRRLYADRIDWPVDD